MRWVVAQFLLIAAIVGSWFVPPHVNATALHWLGVALAVAGAALFAWAVGALGRSLTPLPRPRADAELVTRGPFRLVRHPIYLGALLFFTGLSLRFSWVGVVLSAELGVLWFFKARVEERHLVQRFPEYAEYRRRVRF